MLIIAHRGHSAGHPENSTAAFNAAIACGADLIETDVRLTRDGVAVCCHDPDLQRFSGRPLAVADLERDELAAAMAACGRTLLTLDAVLAIAYGRTRVMLDVKALSAEMAAVIVAALSASGMKHNVVYGVRDPAQYGPLRRLAPQLSLLAMPPDPELLPEFLAPGVIAVRLWEHEVSPARVARIHTAGRKAWVTAGLKSAGEAPGEIDADRLLRLHQMAVDGVLLNDPQLARDTITGQQRILS